MGMTVRELVTRWGFEIDQKPLAAMENRVSGLKLSMAAFAGFAVSKATAVFALAESASTTAKSVSFMSQQVGMATGRFQELREAAEHSGVEVEQFTVAMRLLSRHAYDASTGSEQARKGFAAIGVQVTDANGKLKTSDALLYEVAAKFKTMENGVKKTALAQELFGRSGALMIPMLSKGAEGLRAASAEAHKYGIVMSDEAIAKAKTFREVQKDLKEMLEGLRLTLGSRVIPAVTRMMEALKSWAEANAGRVTEQLGRALEQMATSLGSAVDFFVTMLDIGMKVTAMLGGLGNVLKIVGIGFAIWATAETVIKIIEVVRAVQMLAAAMRTLAIWEAIATGGTSLLLGGLAAAGLGLSMYAIGGGRDESSWRPTSGPSSASSTTVINLNASANVEAKGPGAHEIATVVTQQQQSMLRALAADMTPSAVR
jgi:hypothetical protein